jgi:hypothetical protein
MDDEAQRQRVERITDNIKQMAGDFSAEREKQIMRILASAIEANEWEGPEISKSATRGLDRLTAPVLLGKARLARGSHRGSQ